VLGGALDHAAPARLRDGRAEADEGQSGLDEHADGEDQGRLDHDGVGQARQHVAEADAGRADAVHLGGVHVELGLQGLRLAQHHPVDARGDQHAQDPHDHRDVGSHGTDHGQDDHRAGQGHHDFRGAADHRLHPFAGGRCQHRQEGSEADGDNHRDH
jgi:hypothetical protein